MLSNYAAEGSNVDKIVGYRALSEQEIRRINNIKELANMTGALISVMENDLSLDRRWVAIAKTDLQKGFMALTRAIAQPESF